MENLEHIQLLGPALSLGLGAIGSCIGCYIAGIASHAAMARVEEGHGKYIAMASAPASQCIYGFILMLLMTGKIKAMELSPINAAFVGLFAGLSFMFSAIYQGKVCATGIQASLKQPGVYGKCFAAIGILESFALFALVFSLQII
jgi:V/A-type H+/Na+-transporting ATPase subunit K